MKRRLPKSKQFRNLAYLCLIALTLLLACVTDLISAWIWFGVTAVYFWPQGNYGKRGVE